MTRRGLRNESDDEGGESPRAEDELLGSYFFRLATKGVLPVDEFSIGLEPLRKKGAVPNVVEIKVKRSGVDDNVDTVQVFRDGCNVGVYSANDVFVQRKTRDKSKKDWKERVGLLGVEGKDWIPLKVLEEGTFSRKKKERGRKKARKADKESGKKRRVRKRPRTLPTLSNQEDATDKNDKTDRGVGSPVSSAVVQKESDDDQSRHSHGNDSESELNKEEDKLRKQQADTFYEIFGVTKDEGEDFLLKSSFKSKLHPKEKLERTPGDNAESSQRSPQGRERLSKSTKDERQSESSSPKSEISRKRIRRKETGNLPTEQKDAVESTSQGSRRRPSRRAVKDVAMQYSERSFSDDGASESDSDAEVRVQPPSQRSPSVEQTDVDQDGSGQAGPFETLARLRDPKKLALYTQFAKNDTVLHLRESKTADDAYSDVSILPYLGCLCSSYAEAMRSYGGVTSVDEALVSLEEESWAKVAREFRSRSELPPILGVKDVASLCSLMTMCLDMKSMRTAWCAVPNLTKNVIHFSIATINHCHEAMQTMEHSTMNKVATLLLVSAAECSRSISRLIVHESNLPFSNSPSRRRLLRRPSKTDYILTSGSGNSHAYELLVLEQYSISVASKKCLDLVIAAEGLRRHVSQTRLGLLALIETAVIYKALWKARDGAFGLALDSVERKLITHPGFYPHAFESYLRLFCKNNPKAVAFVSQTVSSSDFVRRLYGLESDDRRTVLAAIVDRFSFVSAEPVKRMGKLSEEERARHELPKDTPGIMDTVISILGLAVMQREIMGDCALRKEFLRALKMLFSRTSSAIEECREAAKKEDESEGTALSNEVRHTASYAARMLGAIVKSMEACGGEARTYTLKYLISESFGSQRQLEAFDRSISCIQGVLERGDIDDRERDLFAMAAFRVQEKLKQGAQRRRQSTDVSEPEREIRASSQSSPVESHSSHAGARSETSTLPESAMQFKLMGKVGGAVLNSLKQAILKDEDMEGDGRILEFAIEVRDEDHRRYVDHENVPSTFKRLVKNEYVGSARSLLPKIPRVGPCSCIPGAPGYTGSAAVACSTKACTARAVLYECDPGECGAKETCCNQRFQKQQYAPFKVSVASNPKLGFAAKATAAIVQGTFIGEYQGEVITKEEFERRKAEYQGERHFYFMNLESGLYIDASRKAQTTRFINHSCDPNATTEKWYVRGEPRIGIFAKRAIGKGEEITFDYQSSRNSSFLKAVRCLCGTAKCRGYLVGGSNEEDGSPKGTDVADELSSVVEDNESIAKVKIAKINSLIEYAREQLKDRKTKPRETSEAQEPSRQSVLRAEEWEKRLKDAYNPERAKMLMSEVEHQELQATMDGVPRIPRRSPAEQDIGIPRKRASEEAMDSKKHSPEEVLNVDRLELDGRTRDSQASGDGFFPSRSKEIEVINIDEPPRKERKVPSTRTASKRRTKFLRMDYNSKHSSQSKRPIDHEAGDESDYYSTCSSPSPIYDEPSVSPLHTTDGPQSDDEFVTASPLVPIRGAEKLSDGPSWALSRSHGQHEYASRERLQEDVSQRRVRDDPHNRTQTTSQNMGARAARGQDSYYTSERTILHGEDGIHPSSQRWRHEVHEYSGQRRKEKYPRGFQHDQRSLRRAEDGRPPLSRHSFPLVQQNRSREGRENLHRNLQKGRERRFSSHSSHDMNDRQFRPDREAAYASNDDRGHSHVARGSRRREGQLECTGRAVETRLGLPEPKYGQDSYPREKGLSVQKATHDEQQSLLSPGRRTGQRGSRDPSGQYGWAASAGQLARDRYNSKGSYDQRDPDYKSGRTEGPAESSRRNRFGDQPETGPRERRQKDWKSQVHGEGNVPHEIASDGAIGNNMQGQECGDVRKNYMEQAQVESMFASEKDRTGYPRAERESTAAKHRNANRADAKLSAELEAEEADSRPQVDADVKSRSNALSQSAVPVRTKHGDAKMEPKGKRNGPRPSTAKDASDSQSLRKVREEGKQNGTRADEQASCEQEAKDKRPSLTTDLKRSKEQFGEPASRDREGKRRRISGPGGQEIRMRSNEIGPTDLRQLLDRGRSGNIQSMHGPAKDSRRGGVDRTKVIRRGRGSARYRQLC